MASAEQWLDGARPRTLTAAVVPVGVGTAVAAADGTVVWWRAAAAFVVALGMQIGVNYANDYSDGMRGADAQRIGPTRLVASGLADPQRVRLAAAACFAAAGIAGLALAAVSSWWLVAVGISAIIAAWTYTGGPVPYGYHALGEISVFVFFGLVAVMGTVYVHLDRITGLAIAAALPVGLIICALLVVNNLRDIPGDARAGKRTLAVVLGEHRTRRLYAGCVLLALITALGIATVRPWALLAQFAILPAVPPLRTVLSGGTGALLVKALGDTGRLVLIFGILLASGIAI